MYHTNTSCLVDVGQATGHALSENHDIPTVINLSSPHQDPVLPDRVAKEYFLYKVEQATVDVAALESFIEEEFKGKAKVYDNDTNVSVNLKHLFFEDPAFQNMPITAYLKFPRNRLPYVRVEFNLTSELIESTLNGDKLSSQQRISSRKDMADWLDIGHTPKQNHITLVNRYTNLSPQEWLKLVDQIDRNINLLVINTMLKILRQVPEYIYLQPSDIGWAWKVFEISQDIHIPHGIGLWQPVVGWATQYLSFSINNPFTNIKYGNANPLSGDSWSKKEMTPIRKQLAEIEGFKTYEAYSRFYRGHAHTIYLYRGTNVRTTDLEAMLAIYPELKGRDGISRNLCRLEFRPRQKSFKGRGYLSELSHGRPSELIAAHQPMFLPPLPQTLPSIKNFLLNHLVEDYLKAVRFTKIQQMALFKGRSVKIKKNRLDVLSPWLFEEVKPKKGNATSAATNSVSVRLRSEVIALMFAEFQSCREVSLMEQPKLMSRGGGLQNEYLAVIDSLIAVNGDKSKVQLASLRKVHPTLQWRERSSRLDRKLQLYIKGWKDHLPTNLEQLKEIRMITVNSQQFATGAING